MDNINNIINTCVSSAYFDNIQMSLIYYSHLIPVFFILLLGFIVFFKNKKNILVRIFFSFSIIFSLWLIGDLITWVSINYFLINSFWSPLPFIEILFFVFGFYFLYVFSQKKDFSLFQKILVLLSLFYPFYITFIGESTKEFYHPICESTNNHILDKYKLIIGIIILILTLYYFLKPFIKKYKDKNLDKKTHIIVFTSMFLFLSVFGIAEYISATTGNYEIHLYALFIIPLFLVSIIYSIFTLDIFNFKIVSTYFLVFGYLILSFSQLLFIQSGIDRILSLISVSVAIILSLVLFGNLKKETNHRIEIQKLNTNLKDLLGQRESLVHLITHKVKASFTRSKYIFSEMLAGTFGSLSPEVLDISKKGLTSDNEGIKTVDLVLNAFNLQRGIVKYEKINFNFKDLVIESFEARKPISELKGVKMEIEVDDGDFPVLGDPFWLREVTNNLMENSVRYTKEGKIEVKLKRNKNKLLFTVSDTGVGISDEDKKNLFKEGGRGKDSTKINVDSTGYGLFSVKLITEAHGGRVWAESAGEGKGSLFSVELPLNQ